MAGRIFCESERVGLRAFEEADTPYVRAPHAPHTPSPPYVPEGELRYRDECARYMRSRRTLEEAAQKGVTLEAGCIMCDCSAMLLSVELPDGIRGVIPREEAMWSENGEIKDIAVITRVGKPVQFKITELRGDCAVLSRRAAQLECAKNYTSMLTPGDIIPARITHLEPFGAFCDIGCGLVSLLTVDRISVSRISHPADRFRCGDHISAVVQSVEEDGRIYLTHRELLGTWEENAAMFSAGQTVTGVIRSVEPYGVFVELAPNLAGLAEPFDGAYPGDTCSVYIKSIIPDRMKIKLALIEVCEASSLPSALREWSYFAPSSAYHIDYWRYSPPNCSKLVETRF